MSGPRAVYVGSRQPMTKQDWLDLGWTEEESEQMARDTSQTATRVMVVTPTGVEPLPHVVRHSPTGFEWGYSGSGPADLALSIVCHALDLRGDGRWASRLVRSDGRGLFIEPPYQRFKEEQIASLDRREPWSIDATDVLDWLEGAGYSLTDATWTDEDVAP
jgi:hypothetical protein